MSSSNRTRKRRKLFLALFLFLLYPGRAPAQLPQNGPALTSDQQEQIGQVASRILKNASKANCKGRDCRIAVADFTFSSGLTSPLGMALADQFAQALAAQKNAVPIIDRAQFRSDLERQRIPGELLNNEKALRWLGQAAGATAILTGTIEGSGQSQHLRVHLMSCTKEKASKQKTGPEESFAFSYSGPANDLSPTEAFAPQLPAGEAFSPPAIREAGKNGVRPPSCAYCPNPSYTEPARLAKLNGTAMMEVVVSAEGQVAQMRIVKGLPYGLNEAAMEAVRNWKFRPSTLNGEPTTVKVMIEVMFRLY
ncbi:MAG TPA: TonB family protein [Terriglobales bacterium]|nr:TonB family protein [Terriglobales bacterium]